MAGNPSKYSMPIFLLGTLSGWVLSAMMRSNTSKIAQPVPIAGPLPHAVSNILGHMRADILNVMQPMVPVEGDSKRLSDLIQDAIEILRKAYQSLNRLVDSGHSFSQEKGKILNSIGNLASLDEIILLNDPKLKEALGFIEQQTGAMEASAKRMTNATEAVAQLNNIIGAAKNIVEAFNKKGDTTS